MTDQDTGGILEHVTTPGPDLRDDTAAMLETAGITVTAEGKAEARRKRLAAAERRTPEVREALRRQLGLSADAA
ncbi:hypothetical protein ACNTMW_30900 [Planosporangium sp. 12N6]|uniref:hypothetical protein n=1 Tax=Planosporangium spinosum TaxID=3402278 RepID=UPI003CEFED99